MAERWGQEERRGQEERQHVLALEVKGCTFLQLQERLQQPELPLDNTNVTLVCVLNT